MERLEQQIELRQSRPNGKQAEDPLAHQFAASPIHGRHAEQETLRTNLGLLPPTEPAHGVTGGLFPALSTRHAPSVQFSSAEGRIIKDMFVKQRAHLPPHVQTSSATEEIQPSAPIALFQNIMEDWGFSDEQAATLLGFDDASAMTDLYRGIMTLRQRDAKDRLKAIISIAADLDALYRDSQTVRRWLREPQKKLGGETPLSLLGEGSMANLLRLHQYAEYLSGR